MRLMLKVKATVCRKPGFERFQRSITVNEPGPVAIGNIFADMGTVGGDIPCDEKVLNWYTITEYPKHRMPLNDYCYILIYACQSIQLYAECGWDYVYSFSIIPFKNFAHKIQIRERIRHFLDSCAINGRFVLGTGNSVAQYMPIKN